MDDIRYTKRARQACEPCRRKKSRCPGERPSCSYCERLGQKCVYNSGELDVIQAKKMEHRMESLEGKMDQLIQQLNPATTASLETAQAFQAPTPRSHIFMNDCWPADRSRREDDSNRVWPETGLLEAGKLYLRWCHNQPVALFQEESFLDSFRTREHELQLAVQALSLRFPPGALTPKRQQEILTLATASRKRAMERITEGQVDLSTLQTLCLLSMVDFTDGKTVQAGLNLAMASHLAHSLQPGTALGDHKECSDCIQSILMLQNLQGCVFPSAKLAIGAPFPSQLTEVHSNGQTELDMVYYTRQLSEVWLRAREYAACRVGSDSPPPWSSQSDYSTVMLRHVEVDCSVPLKYRFSANKIGEYDGEILQQRRVYWGPWLFIQVIYAAIPCLLNHPFLLSMRLRNFRHTLPQSFIHQSFEAITRHAGWIMYFIELLEKKSFDVSDPTLAHCVAIVATIHLQHSFVKDHSLRNKAQEGFDKCLKFLCRMASMWPSVALMAENLCKLQESVMVVPSPGPTDSAVPESRQAFSIDAQLLWDILVYERAGQQGAAADQTMFRESVKSKIARRGNESSMTMAEFDLVGSAGISGHKSVPQDIPAYAPNESQDLTEATNYQRNNDEQVPEVGGLTENRYFEAVGGFGEQENLFLQANDFGKAIDNWLNFDMA